MKGSHLRRWWDLWRICRQCSRQVGSTYPSRPAREARPTSDSCLPSAPERKRKAPLRNSGGIPSGAWEGSHGVRLHYSRGASTASQRRRLQWRESSSRFARQRISDAARNGFQIRLRQGSLLRSSHLIANLLRQFLTGLAPEEP